MGMLNDIGLSVSFLVPRIYTGLSPANPIGNPGFESSGAGGADVFAVWAENTDSGKASFLRDALNYHSGSKSCKITSTAAAEADPPGNGTVSQSISVSPRDSYILKFWTKVSGSFGDLQGHYAIYDDTNAAWIIAKRPTGALSQSTWLEVSSIFTVPPDCVSITIYLYQCIATQDSPSVWYDDVSLQLRTQAPVDNIPTWHEIDDIDSYSHTTSVNLGFDSMTVGTKGSEYFVNDWLEYGLGRSVIVRDTSMGIVWEGFVDQIIANFGGVSLTVGPLMDVINRTRMVYKELNFDTTPPVGGATLRTEWIDVDTSQNKFGILEGVITGGEGTIDEMEQLVRTLVQYVAWPDIEQGISFSGAPEVTLTIRCLGFGHMLDKFYYEETGQAGMENASDKIGKVLEADPNGLFSRYNGVIETNTTEVPKYESDDRTALDIIKDITVLGNSNYDRYVFGVYENRTFFYGAIPSDVKYIQRLSDGYIETKDGAELRPWQVRPNNWVFLADIITGKPSIVQNLREDPRYAYIEGVTFTAPYQLSITAGRTSKFKQRLERLGLGGI